MINIDAGYVYNRIEVENIGRGLLILKVCATEESPTKVETPIEYREFVKRFETDLFGELSKLSKEFPKYESLLSELREWAGKNILELGEEAKEKYKFFLKRLQNILAKDMDFLQSFLGAIIKAIAKNSELINEIRKIISVYESIVSTNIIVVNPFDEVILTKENNEIYFKIEQTDAIFNEYENIILSSKIVLKRSKKVDFPVKFPLYKLFKWRS